MESLYCMAALAAASSAVVMQGGAEHVGDLAHMQWAKPSRKGPVLRGRRNC